MCLINLCDSDTHTFNIIHQFFSTHCVLFIKAMFTLTTVQCPHPFQWNHCSTVGTARSKLLSLASVKTQFSGTQRWTCWSIKEEKTAFWVSWHMAVIEIYITHTLHNAVQVLKEMANDFWCSLNYVVYDSSPKGHITLDKLSVGHFSLQRCQSTLTHTDGHMYVWSVFYSSWQQEFKECASLSEVRNVSCLRADLNLPLDFRFFGPWLKLSSELHVHE